MSNPEEADYRIVSVSPNQIELEVLDPVSFKSKGDIPLTIGSYLKISDDDGLAIIAVIKSFRLRDQSISEIDASTANISFILQAQPVGFLDEHGSFKRGGQQIAIPPTNVELASETTLKAIYQPDDNQKAYTFGCLAQDKNIPVMLDGDKFFGKHIAVIGATGSGKSCTVAKILQEGIQPSADQNAKGVLNNSHIVIFDVHGEYATAFPEAEKLSVDNLVLPYWLLNSEELEEMFIESGEGNSHNQASMFKRAVTLNKRKYHPKMRDVNYDSPIYFSLTEVVRFIRNQNFATKDAKTAELKYKNPESLETIEKDFWLFEEIEFEEKATGKINDGPYYGEFHRFLSRLETKVSDDRIGFLLKPKKIEGKDLSTSDLENILRSILGYRSNGKANVTVIDLSGIPFEVLSVVVSLVSRLTFDFALHFKRLKSANEEVPILLVYEEAHRYVPNQGGARYSSVRRSIERVAKEGRKYGLSLMVVSQRPSEVSETIFSQCNNYVAMRLTNPSDQNYVRKLLPDDLCGVTDSLSTLEQRECILIGDACNLPTLMRVGDLTNKPDSEDIHFHSEWKKDWLDAQFSKVVAKMTKA
jgi:DNA helicase HerA-like ATPase